MSWPCRGRPSRRATSSLVFVSATVQTRSESISARSRCRSVDAGLRRLVTSSCKCVAINSRRPLEGSERSEGPRSTHRSAQGSEECWLVSRKWEAVVVCNLLRGTRSLVHYPLEHGCALLLLTTSEHLLRCRSAGSTTESTPNPPTNQLPSHRLSPTCSRGRHRPSHPTTTRTSPQV